MGRVCGGHDNYRGGGDKQRTGVYLLYLPIDPDLVGESERAKSGAAKHKTIKRPTDKRRKETLRDAQAQGRPDFFSRQERQTDGERDGWQVSKRGKEADGNKEEERPAN